MGYSGAIRVNKESLYHEGKCDGNYCMLYAEAYNKQKPTILTEEAIKETLKQLNGSVCSYSSVMSDIIATGKLINSLAALLNGSYRDFFDENNEFLLVAKLQNSDTYGNSTTINFYDKDDVADVPEVKLHERIFISEEQLTLMKRKRVNYIDTISIFSMLDGLRDEVKNTREKYHEYVERILKIKTRKDVSDLIANMNEYYHSLNKLYEKKYDFTIKLTTILDSALARIKSGEEVMVSTKEKTLYIFTKNEYAKIEFEKFFQVSNLFKSAGTTSLDSSCTINNLKDFERLLNTFETMEEKERCRYVEDLLFDTYNKLKSNNKEFTVFIYGGY